MNRKENALKIFGGEFNCSQAVFAAFSEDFGLDKETALKITTGFGGGVRKGEVCGAVSGAVMALGLKYGHSIENDLETKTKAYALTKEFNRRFEERNGSIVCKTLLGYNSSIPEELVIIKEKGLFDKICPKLITDAVEILEEILEENK